MSRVRLTFAIAVASFAVAACVPASTVSPDELGYDPAAPQVSIPPGFNEEMDKESEPKVIEGEQNGQVNDSGRDGTDSDEPLDAADLRPGKYVIKTKGDSFTFGMSSETECRMIGMARDIVTDEKVGYVHLEGDTASECGPSEERDDFLTAPKVITFLVDDNGARVVKFEYAN